MNGLPGQPVVEEEHVHDSDDDVDEASGDMSDEESAIDEDDRYVLARETEDSTVSIEFSLRALQEEMRELHAFVVENMLVSCQEAMRRMAQGPEQKMEFMLRLVKVLQRMWEFASHRLRKKHEAGNARSLPLPVADLLAKNGQLRAYVMVAQLGLDLAEKTDIANLGDTLHRDALSLLRLLCVFMTEKVPLIDEGVVEILCTVLSNPTLRPRSSIDTVAALQNMCFYRFREGGRNPNQLRAIKAGALDVLLGAHSIALERRDEHHRFQIELSLANLLMEKNACREALQSRSTDAQRRHSTTAHSTEGCSDEHRSAATPVMKALTVVEETVIQGRLLNLADDMLKQCFGHWIGLQSMVPLLGSPLAALRIFGLHCLRNLAKIEKYIRNAQLWRDLALNEGVQPVRRLLWEAEALVADAESRQSDMESMSASATASSRGGGLQVEHWRQARDTAREFLLQLNVHPHEERVAAISSEDCQSTDAATVSPAAHGATAAASTDQQELAANFAALRTDPVLQELCDLTLLVPPQLRIRVHRCVIMARSPMLRRMLTSSFKESVAGEVELAELTGMSKDAVELVVSYMYKGSLGLPVELAAEVLHAADVLMMPILRSLCEDLLSQYVDLESVAELLRIADSYRCERLLRRCVDFARMHRQSLSEQLRESAALPRHVHDRIFEEDDDAASEKPPKKTQKDGSTGAGHAKRSLVSQDSR
eukprot:TRINITY_DN8740_c0_g1_i1.p1 TRINITY_DN8740_c0_g1~~TRINITY_DN8740_c0_g1_i1.p1  ORF type:complete len:710 (+),score=128.83 TRINITY_DN8740_c0_g1_i1:110-2239(+)